MKRLAISTAALSVFLVGCSSDGSNPDGEVQGDFSVVHVPVKGGKAECVVHDGGYNGGMDCRWPGE